MFFISPPFSNYLQLPNTISIQGSFTLEPRSGLFLQILKTLRYSFEYKGWVNKIGLRNKGIDWALKNVPEKDIISIAIMNENDIQKLNNKIPSNRNIEINVSCPNINKSLISDGLKPFLNKERKWCIIKLSPKTENKEIDKFYKSGFRQFHCCNTIPVKEGGLSGPSLRPYTNEKIEYIKNKYPDSEIISGGGIQSWNDVECYKRIGASHFSASTIFFNPYKALQLYYKYTNNIKN